MATWSKDNVMNFIEKYRSFECLWKVKSRDYSNRQKREQAYQELVNYVQLFEPGADKDFIIKKINNLRNSFRKQLRKVDASMLSGAGTEDVYEPKLWYFSALEFLRDQEIHRSAQSNLDLDIVEETCTPGDVEIDLPHGSSQTDSLTPVSSESLCPTPLLAQNAGQGAGNSSRSSSSSSSSRPTKREASAESELLTLARHRLLNAQNVREEDEFDTFAKTIGHKLRHLPKVQSNHAQKLISDIMYEAEFVTLSRNTVIVNRNLTYEQPQQQYPEIGLEAYRSYDYS